MPKIADKPEKLGDAPIDEAYRDLMNDLAQDIDQFVNGGLKGKDRHTGFILMMFPFGQDPTHRCNYISNARRSDVVELLRNQLKRFEEQEKK
jgi:hypothetical protein